MLSLVDWVLWGCVGGLERIVECLADSAKRTGGKDALGKNEESCFM